MTSMVLQQLIERLLIKKTLDQTTVIETIFGSLEVLLKLLRISVYWVSCGRMTCASDCTASGFRFLGDFGCEDRKASSFG